MFSTLLRFLDGYQLPTLLLCFRLFFPLKLLHTRHVCYLKDSDCIVQFSIFTECLQILTLYEVLHCRLCKSGGAKYSQTSETLLSVSAKKINYTFNA